MLKTEISQRDTAMAEGKTGSAGLFAKRVQKQFSRAQEKVLVLRCFFSFICFIMGWKGTATQLSFLFSKNVLQK